MQQFGFIPGGERGSASSPGLCPSWSRILWGTEPPVLHSIVQMQEVHCSLPWEMTSASLTMWQIRKLRPLEMEFFCQPISSRAWSDTSGFWSQIKFSTATCSCDVSTSVLGDTVLYKGLASSSLPPYSQQSNNSQVQLVSGSAAAALPGLHPQATLSNSLLGLTCYAFTTSSGPGNVSPAAPCCWEGTCQQPQLSCRGVELCIFYMVHLEQDGARTIKIKQLHLSAFRTRYQADEIF